MPPPISLAFVENAARAIRRKIDDTPFLLSDTFSEIACCEWRFNYRPIGRMQDTLMRWWFK